MQSFKPHHLCWLSIGFVLLQGFISFRTPVTFDILEFHYVMNRWIVISIMMVPFLLLGVAYKFMFPAKRKWLSSAAMMQIALLLVPVMLISIAGNNLSSLENANLQQQQAVDYLNSVLYNTSLICMVISLIIFLLIVFFQFSGRKTN